MKLKCHYHLMTSFNSASNNSKFIVQKIKHRYKKVGKAYEQLDNKICDSCRNNAEYKMGKL